MSYYYTKLEPKSVSFINKVKRGDYTRGDIFSLAVARVLSFKYPIPTVEVKEPLDYLRLNHSMEMMGEIDKLNDLLIVDIDRIKDLTYKLYLLRASFISDDLAATRASLFGFNIHLSPNEMQLLNNTEELAELVRGIKMILADLKEV